MVVALQPAHAQQPVQLLDSAHKTSLRGLSVVNDSVFWASGSNGMVARSTDGGKHIQWIQVPGFEKRDFRDIEALNDKIAVIMAVAEPAVLLQTTDGGSSWTKVFEDTAKGMFLDAMAFSPDGRRGFVIGDPLQNNRPYLAATEDGGYSWFKVNTIADKQLPLLSTGEAFFASSGTNLCFMQQKLVFVTGGIKSRIVLYNNLRNDSLPIMQGQTSTGANSIASAASGNYAVVVGGDFAKDTIAHDNCVLVKLTGKGFSFNKPVTSPHGYRSCVIFTGKHSLVTCGTSGVDVSGDDGSNWQLLTRQGFHVVQQARNGHRVYFAGSNGRIAVMNAGYTDK
ncbi:WD40/YVTN/BNR-like repeat-containing protein [Deminuibacter soli]|nr:oxidoreductase [Deminuibacter soli]